MKIAVVNGPNLNLLGSREPGLYGHATLAEIEDRLRAVARELKVDLECAQYNGEGQIIDGIHALRVTDGVLINAGAYSHTSLAIRDALVGVGVPFVEVHISNVFAREVERHRSVLAPAALATLSGFGAHGYELALRGLVALLAARG
ncbi:MAG: type II 3-dehydroquinate dehydratase [Gemmatimonadaceae bacterium]